MKTLTTLIMTLAAALLAATVLAPPATFAEGAEGDEGDAQTLYVETFKCNMCHGVAAVGIEAKTTSEKMKGIDLSGYKTDKELAEIAAYARKEADLDGKTHKKGFKGTDEELQTILDWLGSLEAQE